MSCQNRLLRVRISGFSSRAYWVVQTSDYWLRPVCPMYWVGQAEHCSLQTLHFSFSGICFSILKKKIRNFEPNRTPGRAKMVLESREIWKMLLRNRRRIYFFRFLSQMIVIVPSRKREVSFFLKCYLIFIVIRLGIVRPMIVSFSSFRMKGESRIDTKRCTSKLMAGSLGDEWW